MAKKKPAQVAQTVTKADPKREKTIKNREARLARHLKKHPNDAVAAALGEPDVGKTEMWHVLEAVPGSRLYCGLKPGVDAPRLRTAIERNAFDDLLVQFPVVPATSVFVPAGTVHAIGSGILLAEIQQNSDLTYRLYDWGRLQADGTPRDLHIDKGLAATTFDHGHQGPARPLTHHRDGGECEVLAACSHFAAERIRVRGGSLTRKTGGRSFYIILGKCSHVAVTAGATTRAVRPGEAVLVAGEATEYTLEGSGSVLAYYVPDLDLDIREPLRAVGCSEDAIARLGLEAG